ncbi:MAG: hypothetical protein ABEJ55_05810 [Halanaeroarchaeum sp.]
MPTHALSEGNELYDRTDAKFTVTDVSDDGSVSLDIEGDAVKRSATWSEDEIATALEEGLLQTSDGKSTELLEV